MSLKDNSSILISRTDRIGDVILTIPLAHRIKEKFPDAKISFLCRNYTKDLPLLCSDIDNVLCIDDYSLLELLRLIRKNKFDFVVVAFPRFLLALVFFLSGIKKRIGTRNRFYSFLFNLPVNIRRKESKKHELEYNGDLLEPLGINTHFSPANVVFNIHTDENTKHLTKLKLSEIGVNFDKKIIILHIGSGNSSVDWPVSHFEELLQLLAQNLHINILMTGNKSESEMINKIIHNEYKNVFNIAGMLSLKELAALMSYTSVFIGNSTGPTHIAAASGVYVIAFYPKVPHCSARRWGPYTLKKHVFEPVIDCTNCTIEQCKETKCMNSISPIMVYNKISDVITEKGD